MQIMTVQINL